MYTAARQTTHGETDLSPEEADYEKERSFSDAVHMNERGNERTKESRRESSLESS